MAHAEHSVIIHRPVDEVFEFIANGANNPRWRPSVVEVQRSGGADGPGAAWSQVMKGPGGRRIAADYRVTTWERPLALGFEVTAGPARPTGLYTLIAAAPDRTEVRFSLDLQPRGLMRLMGPMIAKQVRQEVATLDNLKGVLEA